MTKPKPKRLAASASSTPAESGRPPDLTGPDGADGARAGEDLVLLGGRAAGGGFRVLRQREDRLEVGELRALEEGKPLTGEVVKLRPTEVHERVFACETLHEGDGQNRPTQVGPPQVANAAYRRNWEQIFGAIARRADLADDASEPSAPHADPRKLN